MLTQDDGDLAMIAFDREMKRVDIALTERRAGRGRGIQRGEVDVERETIREIRTRSCKNHKITSSYQNSVDICVGFVLTTEHTNNWKVAVNSSLMKQPSTSLHMNKIMKQVERGS
jgi:hypothetical protein